MGGGGGGTPLPSSKALGRGVPGAVAVMHEAMSCYTHTHTHTHTPKGASTHVSKKAWQRDAGCGRSMDTTPSCGVSASFTHSTQFPDARRRGTRISELMVRSLNLAV